METRGTLANRLCRAWNCSDSYLDRGNSLVSISLALKSLRRNLNFVQARSCVRRPQSEQIEYDPSHSSKIQPIVSSINSRRDCRVLDGHQSIGEWSRPCGFSRDHPSNRWIAVDSGILMSGWKNEVEKGRELEHIYVSQKP